MTDEAADAVLDEILGADWRSARRASGNRVLHAPYREDRNPSLHVHVEKRVWIDRSTGECQE